jgi:hypothetical protein
MGEFMKRFEPSLLILTVVLMASACAEPAAETTPYAKKSGSGSATGQNANALVLNWNAQTGTTAYHIYFSDPTAQVKDREIDSLQKGAANFASPVLAIDNTNMEAWPSKGSKACFYVVAENAGSLSDPSDKACITL